MPGLTSKQVETFWSEGFVAPLPALSPAAARGLRDWVETFERDHPHDRWAFNLKANLLFESVDRLVRDARFFDPVEDLIGPNLLISTAIFRIKKSSSPGYYGWHQDERFIQMGPCWVLVFLAVTDCTVENGCLAVLPGSHRESFMEAQYQCPSPRDCSPIHIGAYAWRGGKRLGYTAFESCRGLVEGVIESSRGQRSLRLGGRRTEKLRTKKLRSDTFPSVGRVFRY